jgi:hypothetical protein
MRRLVVMTATLASTTLARDTDAWWASKSAEFKAGYIKRHPQSKFAKQAAGVPVTPRLKMGSRSTKEEVIQNKLDREKRGNIPRPKPLKKRPPEWLEQHGYNSDGTPKAQPKTAVQVEGKKKADNGATAPKVTKKSLEAQLKDLRQKYSDSRKVTRCVGIRNELQKQMTKVVKEIEKKWPTKEKPQVERKPTKKERVMNQLMGNLADGRPAPADNKAKTLMEKVQTKLKKQVRKKMNGPMGGYD